MSRDWTLYLREILEYTGYVADFSTEMSFDEFRADARTQHTVISATTLP